MSQPEEFGTPCVCGCEHFERVVVERVLGRPVITDLLACVECRCVYYSPLPAPASMPAKEPVKAWTPPSTDAGLLSRYGGPVPGSKPLEHSAKEQQRHAEAVKRTDKGKRRDLR